MAESNQDIHDDGSGRSVQDRLIEAAEELFCRRGFNETSVRDIAAAAGCNVASVNYYFGGKDNLYREIWRRRLTQMRDARLAGIEGAMSAEGQPRLEDLLAAYAKSFLEPWVGGSAHCRFVNLMAREMIDPHLPRDMFVTEMVIPATAAMTKALITLCPWLDEAEAGMVILSIVGQLVQTICAKTMFEESGHPQAPRVDIDRYLDHVVKFSAAGIRAYADRPVEA